MNNVRYARQMVLPEIGAEGQKKLQEARVLCVGAGGLGSPVALYLAASGIGTIGIMDDDTVDLSNLQRQILFKTNHQSQPKAFIAKQEIEALNPDIVCHAYNAQLSAENAESLFTEYDIIIDGTDNLASKYLINDAAVKYNKPVVYGSILGFQGQASVFFAECGPCYRCLFPDEHAVVANCAEAGVIGALAGIIGSIQAMEAIKLALGLEFCRSRGLNVLMGQLYIYDAKTLHTRIIPFERDPHCAVCAKKRDEIQLIQNRQEIGTMAVKTIEVQDLPDYQSWQYIDVREDDEWQRGHAEGALLLPLSALRDGTADLSTLPQKDLMIYCQRGKRSLAAAEILQSKGWNVVSLNGGYTALTGE